MENLDPTLWVYVEPGRWHDHRTTTHLLRSDAIGTVCGIERRSKANPWDRGKRISVTSALKSTSCRRCDAKARKLVRQ